MPVRTIILCVVALSTISQPAVAQATLADRLAQPLLQPDTAKTQWAAFIRARIPALEIPNSAAAWDAESGRLRSRFLSEIIYKGVPESWYSAPVRVEWVKDIDTPHGYRIRKLRYEAAPGMWIPALLYEPTAIDGKVPAVLSVNGHVGDPGKANEEEQARRIVLAKRGVVALHPEWLSFGELKHTGNAHYNLANLNLCGVSGMSVFYLAMKRGLDVLAEYPSVDPGRLAMTGLSGGGWQTIILSALDTRVAVSVPNAGYSGIDARVQYPGDIGDLEQVPPDLLTVADFTHLTAMLAPRPALLIYNAKDECCFQAGHMAASVYDPVIPIYDLFGGKENFVMYVNHDPGTHNYAKDNRQQLYAHLSVHFGLGWNNLEPSFDGELKTFDELKVGLPENNATLASLAEPFLASLPVNPAPKEGGIALAEWQESAKERLAEVIRLTELPAATVESETEPTSYTMITDDATGAPATEVSVSAYILKAGEWSVPAWYLAPIAKTDKQTTIMFADSGKVSMIDQAQKVMRDTGGRVLLIDLFLQGERDVAQNQYQYAMMLESTGERELGQNVAQLGSVARWAREAFNAPVAIYSKGWVSGVTALMYGGLHRDKLFHLTTEDAPATLKDLITQRIPYNDFHALYCFGLLKEFDVPDLAAMCQGMKVNVSRLGLR
ncbi:MAG: hypothetical protein SGI88_20560 [Candidatus Hydrogenedentes bacterium]|nr:hypothetical protein [Candidatus Hydrogenedentota bacterium]